MRDGERIRQIARGKAAPALSNGTAKGLSASHPQLKMARIARQWKAHREINERDETIDRERLEGCVVDGVRGPHQFLEADDRCDSRHLHELHKETDHRRARDHHNQRR